MTGRTNDKKVVIDAESTIKKSNEFSLAKFSQGLTLNQTQLLAYAIYATQRGNGASFIKKDFEDKFGITKFQTKQAKVDCEKILGLRLTILDLENDRFNLKNLFQEIDYNKGAFNFKWNESFLPHILNIKDKYILTDLKLASQFNSSFTWTLYEYLKAKYGFWYVILSKEDLMKMFDVQSKKSYINNTGVFRKNVIDVAIDEINKYTELEVTCENIKSSYTIVGFKILWSTGNTVNKASKKQIDILRTFCNATLNDSTMFLGIDNKEDREKAITIINKVIEMRHKYLDGDAGLTAEKYTELAIECDGYIKTMNSILENPLPIEVPMFNWLESEEIPDPTEDEIPEHTVPPADMAAAIRKAYKQLN